VTALDPRGYKPADVWFPLTQLPGSEGDSIFKEAETTAARRAFEEDCKKGAFFAGTSAKDRAHALVEKTVAAPAARQDKATQRRIQQLEKELKTANDNLSKAKTQLTAVRAELKTARVQKVNKPKASPVAQKPCACKGDTAKFERKNTKLSDELAQSQDSARSVHAQLVKSHEIEGNLRDELAMAGERERALQAELVKSRDRERVTQDMLANARETHATALAKTHEDNLAKLVAAYSSGSQTRMVNISDMGQFVSTAITPLVNACVTGGAGSRPQQPWWPQPQFLQPQYVQPGSQMQPPYMQPQLGAQIYTQQQPMPCQQQSFAQPQVVSMSQPALPPQDPSFSLAQRM